MPRVMALDYGTKSIGLAVSDELQLTARPLTTLRRNKLSLAQVFDELVALIERYEIGTLIIGMPFNMDGTRGPAVERVEYFISKLKERIDLPLVTLDERLTSREADAMLRASGATERERRAKSDEYAALILLRDYLEGTAASKEFEAAPLNDYV